MLLAIQAEFAARQHPVRFVVEPHGDYQQRAELGLWQKTRAIRKRVNYLAPLQLLPARLRHRLGLINESEIDLVLDASGFSYGDQWNPVVGSDRLSRSIAKLKRSGTPVVLLPQALGPFTDPRWQQVMRPILAHADRVFARDRLSYEHCQSLLEVTPEGAAGKLQRCPDFTNRLTGKPFTGFDSKQHQLCVIPNSKMLHKRADGERYVAWLVALLKQAQARGAKPFLLLHETNQDRGLVAQVQAQLVEPVAVLEPQDARQIKWVIGQSRIVVSSRFHGLVSALAQGIPAFATGWSHKYQELLSDYDCRKQLVDVHTDTDQLWRDIEELLQDREQYHQLQTRIRNAGQWQLDAVEAMWDQVFSLLK